MTTNILDQKLFNDDIDTIDIKTGYNFIITRKNYEYMTNNTMTNYLEKVAFKIYSKDDNDEYTCLHYRIIKFTDFLKVFDYDELRFMLLPDEDKSEVGMGKISRKILFDDIQYLSNIKNINDCKIEIDYLVFRKG